MSITITAQELRTRHGEPGLLLVDVRARDAWASGTIPGAVCLNVYDYFIPASNEAGIRDLEAATDRAFAALGIDRARTVVYFEEQTGMISPRALWFHEFAGLPDGRILDGGMAAWLAAGGPVAPGSGTAEDIASPAPRRSVPPMRRELIATVEQVLERDPGHCDLLDVRRRSEFEGRFAHPCCARAGRIPGAGFLFWEDLLDQGRYRGPDDIARRAAAAGLSPERAVITYCHRGARAATVMYALKQAGFDRISIFVGSWHEWAAQDDLPAETGAVGESDHRA